MPQQMEGAVESGMRVAESVIGELDRVGAKLARFPQREGPGRQHGGR